MDEPLHPSTLGEILDRTAQLYRGRFLIFLGIAAIPTAALVAPLGGIILLVRWMGLHGDSPTSSVLAGLGIGVVSLVAIPLYVCVASLASAALNHAGSRAIFAQPITIRHAYNAVWRRGWHYVGLYLMQLVAVWVLPFGAWTALVAVSALLSTLAGGAGGLFAFLAFVIIAGLLVYGVWMSIRLSLAFPAAIVEQTGPWAAMRRSWLLTAGTRGRIFLLYLLGSALNWILSLAIMVPALIVLSLVVRADSPQHAQATGFVAMVIIYGSGFAIQAFTRPVYGIGLMLFYYDQRIRQEAFDIEWMMLKAGLVVPQPAPQPAPAPPAALVQPPTAATSAESAATDAVHQPAAEADPNSPSADPAETTPLSTPAPARLESEQPPPGEAL